MTNREKILVFGMFIAAISVDVFYLFSDLALKNSSKYEIKQSAKTELNNLDSSEYKYLKGYIEYKKKSDYYLTLLEETKQKAIKEMNDKKEKDIFIDGVYVDLYYRTVRTKKDTTRKQIIKISY